MLLGLGMMKQRNSQACWSPNERTKETTALWLLSLLPPKEHSDRASWGDFPCSWGAYLNWICCWWKWIGPISQLLITRSWGQMDESSERTLSLILSPLMCCGILMSKREERGRRRPMTLQALIRIHRCMLAHIHTHTLEALSKRQRWLSAVGQTDFTVDRRMRSKTTERCGGECFLRFTCQPAVGAAGSTCQRSACQTQLSKRAFDPSSLWRGSNFSESESGNAFSNFQEMRPLLSVLFNLFWHMGAKLTPNQNVCDENKQDFLFRNSF